MRTHRTAFVPAAALLAVLSSAAGGLAQQTRPADAGELNRRLLERVRRQTPAKAPAWVNAIPDRIGEILLEKHACADGPVWGLARRTPDSPLAYDEMGSATFVAMVRKYDLYDQVGRPSREELQKAIAYWQAWQDPKTGRFHDPRDPAREVNEKYVVSLIHSLGGELLYPWTTTSDSKEVDTAIFLARTKSDPDWPLGGWSVGSHTCLMAVEIMDAINRGQTQLIPDLERGIAQVLAHQDPESGLWGRPEGTLMHRIGGNLKVIGRLYFKLGMTIPFSRELADTLIENQRNGNWFKHGEDSCVPRNVAEMMAYCLEISDYRREDMLDAMQSLADDYRHWVTPDGRTMMHRDRPDTIGIQGTTIYGLGILGAYLHWEDCRIPNPLDGPRGQGMRYRLVLRDGQPKVIDTQAGEAAIPASAQAWLESNRELIRPPGSVGRMNY